MNNYFIEDRERLCHSSLTRSCSLSMKLMCLV